jgi:hypothetical protein
MGGVERSWQQWKRSCVVVRGLSLGVLVFVVVVVRGRRLVVVRG